MIIRLSEATRAALVCNIFLRNLSNSNSPEEENLVVTAQAYKASEPSSVFKQA